MKHPTQDEMLEYFKGEMPDKQAREFAEHLEECEKCAAELESNTADHVRAALEEALRSTSPEGVVMAWSPALSPDAGADGLRESQRLGVECALVTARALVASVRESRLWLLRCIRVGL